MPLDLGLAVAADHPVDVAHMVVDQRVRGHGRNGALHRRHRLRVAAQPVIDPGQRVEDIAIVRAQIDGALDQAQRLVQLLVAVDQTVTQIVQHLRRIRAQLQRLAEIGLGLGELAAALQRDAARIKREPARRAALGPDQRQRLVIGRDRLTELVLLAQKIAKRDPALRQFGMFGGQCQRRLFGIVQPVGPRQRVDARQFRHRAHVAQIAQRVEFRLGQIELAEILQQLRIQQMRLAQLRRQIAGQPGIDQRQRVRLVAAGQRAGKGQEHLRHAIGGRFDRVKGQGLAGAHAVAQRDKLRFLGKARHRLKHGDGVLVALQLRQDLRPRDHAQQMRPGLRIGQQLFGALVIADRGLGQRQMIIHHRARAAHLAQLFKGRQRLPGIARTQKRPCPQHLVHQHRAAGRIAQGLIAGIRGRAVDGIDQILPAPGTCQFRTAHQLRQLGRAALFGHGDRQGARALHLAGRDQGQQR